MRKLRMGEYTPCMTANTFQKDKTMGIFYRSFNDDWIMIIILHSRNCWKYVWLETFGQSGYVYVIEAIWNNPFKFNREAFFLHISTDLLLLNLHFKSPIGYVICVYRFCSVVCYTQHIQLSPETNHASTHLRKEKKWLITLKQWKSARADLLR